MCHFIRSSEPLPPHFSVICSQSTFASKTSLPCTIWSCAQGEPCWDAGYNITTACHKIKLLGIVTCSGAWAGEHLNADFKRATTFHPSRSCEPLLCVSDPELAPRKLTGHCIALGGLFHLHQVAHSCTHRFLCPGCVQCCADFTALLLCLKPAQRQPGELCSVSICTAQIWPAEAVRTGLPEVMGSGISD